MKPSSRLQAAIEILYEYQKGNPAETTITEWGHRHRFAGSSDRRAIADTVYDIIREYGFLSYQMGGNTPRLLVLGWLLHLKHQDIQTIRSLFNGETHAPAKLNPDELQALHHTPQQPADFTARYNLPSWMEQPLQESLKILTQSQLSGLTQRAFFDVRVNSLKSNRDSVLNALEQLDIEAEATPYSDCGIRFAESFSLRDFDLYEKGIIEVQDESSQIACKLLNPQPNTRILDYCAGGGGKALALASLTDNQADIIASDISEKRLLQLKKRAERAGATSIRRIHKDRLHPDHGLFNTVLVDAPCSGSGTWRRNVAEKWILTPEKLEEFQNIQYDILSEASVFTEKDGVLAYTTCSLFKAENEDVVEKFLANHPHFTQISVAEQWQATITASPPPAICQDGVLSGRILTAETKTDSFFMALFRKG